MGDSQMTTKELKQDFKLHDNHSSINSSNPMPHDIKLCGICEVRTIINEGISALIAEAYGPQNG